MSELKFYLQGIDTDMEISLKRNKQFFDWQGKEKSEGLRTDIVFSNEKSINACPVGTIEFIYDYVRDISSYSEFIPLPHLRPISIKSVRPYHHYLGRDIFIMEGGEKIDNDNKGIKYYCKNLDFLKYPGNGWKTKGDILDSSVFGWELSLPIRGNEIVGEYRVFLDRQGEIIDIRNYIGYKYWPCVDTVENIAKIIKEKYPGENLSFDVVVSHTHTKINDIYYTSLLEIHRYFALGLYGFDDPKLPFLMHDWWRLVQEDLKPYI